MVALLTPGMAIAQGIGLIQGIGNIRGISVAGGNNGNGNGNGGSGFVESGLQSYRLSGSGGIAHWNCSSSPNSVVEPGWEWQWNVSQLCLWIDSGFAVSPSLDGFSREFETCWGTGCSPAHGGGSNAGALFHVDLSNTSKTLTSFTWGGYFYYPDLTTTHQLEFDLNQIIDDPGADSNNTATVIMSAQCDFTNSSGTWEFGNGWPNNTGISCIKGSGANQFQTGAWNEVFIGAHRAANGSCAHGVGNCAIVLDWVFLNGTLTNCSSNCTDTTGAYALNWTPSGGFVENVQVGNDGSANGTNHFYADEMLTESPATTP